MSSYKLFENLRQQKEQDVQAIEQAKQQRQQQYQSGIEQGVKANIQSMMQPQPSYPEYVRPNVEQQLQLGAMQPKRGTLVQSPESVAQQMELGRQQVSELKLKQDIEKAKSRRGLIPGAIGGVFGEEAGETAQAVEQSIMNPLGLPNLIEKGLTKIDPRYEAQYLARKQLEQEHPIASTVGRLAGDVVAGAPVFKGIGAGVSRAFPYLGESGTIAGKGITAAAEGAGFGALEGTIAGIEEGRGVRGTAEEALKRAREYGTFGAGLGLATGAVGKGLSRLNRGVEEGVEDIFGSIRPSIEGRGTTAQLPKTLPTQLPKGEFKYKAPTKPFEPKETKPSKYKVKNVPLQRAEENLNDAIETLQNKYQTRDIQGAISDIVNDYAPPARRKIAVDSDYMFDYIKKNDNIDLKKLVKEIDLAEGKRITPTAEQARLKRVAGIAPEKAYARTQKIGEYATAPKTLREKLGIKEVPTEVKPVSKIEPTQTQQEAVESILKARKQPKGKTTIEVKETTLKEQPVKVEPTKTRQKVEEVKPISKTRTNTIERAKELSDEGKKILKTEEFGYAKETVKQWETKAQERYVNNKQGVIDDLMSDKPIGESAGREVMESAMLIKEAEKEALKTGNVEKFLAYTKKYAEKIRENARALKSHDVAWEKEPNAVNAVLKAQNMVTKAQEMKLTANPKLKTKITNDVSKYKEAVEKAFNDVADESLKLLKINLQLFGKFAGKDKKLAEYIKKYYTKDPLSRTEAINNIVKEFGLTGEEGKQIKKIIEKAFNNKFEAQSKAYLKNLLDSKTKQNVTLEKVMKLINAGAYDDVALSNLINEKYGLPTLTKQEAKTILKKMKMLERLNKESDAYRVTLGEVQKIIADKTPATLREKFRGVQRILYLSNPKTLFTRNPVGNIVLNVAENVKEAPGALIDIVTSAVRGTERTTLFNPLEKIKWQSEGFKKGMKDWMIDVKRGIDTSPTRGQLELPSGRTFDTKVLNAIDEFVRKSLQLGDRPFYEAAYNSRVKELLKIKKTNTITNDIKLEARMYALDRVFQGNSVLAKKAGELRKTLGLAGDLIMPFTQTPANILDKLLDYSGGGLIKGLVQMGKTAKKGTPFDQKLFVDRLARTFTGGGILTLGYALAKKGLITGGVDSDADVRNFEYNVGKTPYSIKMGDKYFTFDWAQPISGLLAMGADAYKAGINKEDFLGKAYAGVEAGINTTFKQSFLQGMFNLLSGYSPATSITKTLGSSALGLTTPTASRQLSKVIDPTLRETYSDSKLQEIANRTIKSMPFFSKSLPPKLDTFGKAISEDKGLPLNIFEYMFNPGRLSDYKPSEVQKEIMRVYDKTLNKGIFPSGAPKTIKDPKGETLKLTTEQYQRYQELMGSYTENIMKQVIKSSTYKNKRITDDQRAQSLKKVVSDARDYAKEVLLKEMGLTSKKKKKSKNPIKIPTKIK